MREKTGALIQFLGVIAMFVLVLWGLGGAYQYWFAGGDMLQDDKIYEVVFHLVAAAIGAGVGIAGIIFGSLLKK